MKKIKTQILEDLGLTPAEIKVYLSLLELGQARAGEIIAKTGLYNSVIHTSLNGLAKKGFLSYVTKGQVRHYQASDPEFVIEYIENKKREAQEILPLLKERQKSFEKQEAEVFSGFKGFKVMMTQVIEDGKKGDEYLFFAFHSEEEESFRDLHEYYRNFEREVKRRGFLLRGIAQKGKEHLFRGRDLRNIHFVDFPTLNSMHVFRNKVVFTPWEEGEVSFLVTSSQLADSFRKHFYSIWKK